MLSSAAMKIPVCFLLVLLFFTLLPGTNTDSRTDPYKHVVTDRTKRHAYTCTTYGVEDEMFNGVCYYFYVLRERDRTAMFRITAEVNVNEDPLNHYDIMSYSKQYSTTFNIDDECFPLSNRSVERQWYHVIVYVGHYSWVGIELGFKAGLCHQACKYPIRGDLLLVNSNVEPIGMSLFATPHDYDNGKNVPHNDTILYNTLHSVKTNVCPLHNQNAAAASFNCDQLVIGYAIMFIAITVVIALLIITVGIKASRDQQRLRAATMLTSL